MYRFCFIFLLLCSSLQAAPSQQTENYPRQNNPEFQDDERIVFKAVENFMGSLRRGNISQAYHVYTAKSFRAKTTFDQFQRFVTRFPSIGRNKILDFQEIYFREGVATIVALVVSIDGIEHEAYYIVDFESGQWKILTIQLYPPPNQ